jgi:hypothetical protein
VSQATRQANPVRFPADQGGMNERKVPAWMQEAKPRRRAARDTCEPLSEWPSIKYARQFFGFMMFWGFMALLSASSFPIALGLLFFFAREAFIEWMFQKIGIRFVPDTLGPIFINAFVFLLGGWCLVKYTDSTPKWLLPWLPPVDASWLMLGLLALAYAALKIVSVAVVKKLLPRFGIEMAPDRRDSVILGLMGLVILAIFAMSAVINPDQDWAIQSLVILAFISMLGVSEWFAAHRIREGDRT